MAKVNFYLHHAGRKTEKAIYLFMSFNGKREKISIRESIKPNEWNKTKQRAKAHRKTKNPEYTDLNDLLDALKSNALNEYRKFKTDNKREPTAIEAKNLMKSFWTGVSLSTKKPLQYYRDLIEQRIASDDYAPNSIKAYKSAVNLFQEFSNNKIEFPDINLSLFKSFKTFLKKKKFSNNYIHKTLSTIKTFTNEAAKENYCKKLDISLSNDLKVNKEEVSNIYLTEEELKMLYHFELEQRLGKARDAFIICAYTGLRYVDMRKLNKKDHFRVKNGRSYIYMTTQKTKEKVVIPVHSYVEKLIQDYGGASPKISNAKLNEYLKEIGEKAGLIENVAIERKIGKKIQTEHFRKCDLIATHTGRRSFCTNAYLSDSNMKVPQIMKMSGHKSEREFFNYIKISKEENAILIGDNSFFNAPTLRKVS